MRIHRFIKKITGGRKEYSASSELWICQLIVVLLITVLTSFARAAENLPLSIQADMIHYDKTLDLYHAQGNVSLSYEDALLSADDVELDSTNHTASARGNAFLQVGDDTLRGEKIIFNMQDKTGAAHQADAFYARNHFYIRGDKIEKTGDNTYFIQKPSATTCNHACPDWSIAGSEMKVTIEGYGLMKDAKFLTKGFPVFYIPYLPFPAKTKRQTGLILPYLSYSRDRDGVDIEIPFFWAVSDQMDATFYQRYMGKRGFKEGAELRYYWGDHSRGTLYGDFMEDKLHVTETDDAAISRDWSGTHRRWSYYLHHQTNVGSQFYVRTDLKKVSDPWYFKDFRAHNFYLTNYDDSAEDVFKNVAFQGDASLRYLISSVRLNKSWAHYNLTGLLNYTEDFATAHNAQTLQNFPAIVLTGVKQPLFRTPFYYELTGSYDYLARDKGETGHFVDVAPAISLPADVYGYFKLTPQITFKETFWSRDDHQSDLRAKTDDRTVFNASVSFSSQLSRVFDVNVNHWEKIRHEIKPELIYSYVPDVSADDVPDYYLPVASPFILPMATLPGNPLEKQNAVGWSLTNTLTARVKDADGAHSYLEFLRLKLFQSYDIDEAKRDVTENDVRRKPFSDLGLECDLSPNRYLSFKARSRYNFYDSWRQNTLDLRFKDGRGDALAVGYRHTADFLEEIHFGLKAVMNRHIDCALVSKYDLENSRRIENSLGFTYHRQCWSLGLELTETDQDVRFMLRLSLAGLGKTDTVKAIE
jgi:LPS-assembly protein